MHALFAKYPTPPCAELLGWHLLDGDAASRTARVGFEGRQQFLNPAGFVQGGLIAAMLDDTMGPAVVIASDGALYSTTVDLHVSYLAPARPGPLVGAGRVVQLGKTIGFLEAQLEDAAGVAVARAQSSVRLVPTERLAV